MTFFILLLDVSEYFFRLYVYFVFFIQVVWKAWRRNTIELLLLTQHSTSSLRVRTTGLPQQCQTGLPPAHQQQTLQTVNHLLVIKRVTFLDVSHFQMCHVSRCVTFLDVNQRNLPTGSIGNGVRFKGPPYHRAYCVELQSLPGVLSPSGRLWL